MPRETAEQRFWKYVIKRSPDDCWEWSGWIGSNGYGGFHAEGKHVRAHRFSWQLHNTKIPRGMCICHTCDNRKCVNPNHLFVGTYKDNVHDSMKKGRFFHPKVDMENNGMAKLTVSDVKKIRCMYEKGEMTQKDIGKTFGVTQANISIITKRTGWNKI